MQQEIAKHPCPWILWNKNPIKRAEIREKIRVSKLGNTYGKANKGKKREPMSESARYKLSLALKGKQNSAETRAKISQALTGHKLSDEHKKSLSMGQYRRFSSPIERELARQRNLMRWACLTDEEKATMIKPMLESGKDWANKPGGDERRKAISIGNTRAWRRMTLEERQQIARKSVATSIVRGTKYLPKARPNRAEKKLQQLLGGLFPNEYKYTGGGEIWIGSRNPDFINVNGKKAVIELWGTYWHAGKDPEELIRHYRKYGFNCLVIWEQELVDEQVHLLTEKLLRFHQCEMKEKINFCPRVIKQRVLL